MHSQAMNMFLDKLFPPSGSLRMLRALLAIFALWAVAAPLLGINDILELGINLGIGIIILALSYLFMRVRKHNLDSSRITLQEFIFTDKITRNIALHDLTTEQIENFRSELRSMCDDTAAPGIERLYRERKNDSPVDSQANYRMAA